MSSTIQPLRRAIGLGSDANGLNGDTPRLGDKAVTFDLDGTLVDLRAAYIRAHQQAAREVLDLNLGEARVLELMSTGVPIRAHTALLDASAADRLVAVFVERYRLERDGHARPFPGMVALLRRLREADIGVAVVTSKLREDALAELPATGLNEHVEVLVAFEDTDEHKPAATPQREALRRLRARAGAGVGDLPSDIASARAAGLAAIGVSWGYGARNALREVGAEHVCDSAEELEQELGMRLGERVP